MGTVITLLILAAIVTAIIMKMIKNKKSGKCSCGCSGCASRELCESSRDKRN